MPTDDINCQETSDASIDETELPNHLNDFENGSYNVDNVILSRTLKRKFTELEEISQRLKSRLLDVTAADDHFDVDDEFENDLNTCPDEDDVDSKDQFDWNRFSTLEIDCSSEAEADTEPRSDAVDHVDCLAKALKQSVLNISSANANSLPVGENTSMDVQTSE